MSAEDLQPILSRLVEPDLAAVIADRGVPGAAVAVIVEGERWGAGIGHADLDGSRALPADAAGYAYSVSKVMIAAVVLRLVEEGRLTLDQTVATGFPELSVDPAITVRRLLNHTSGIGDYGGLAEYQEAVRRTPASA